jgi:hypothetical protein
MPFASNKSFYGIELRDISQVLSQLSVNHYFRKNMNSSITITVPGG